MAVLGKLFSFGKKEPEKRISISDITKELKDDKINNPEKISDSIVGFNGSYEFLSNNYKTKIEQYGIVYSSCEAAIAAERMMIMSKNVYNKYKNKESIKAGYNKEEVKASLGSSLEKITRMKFKQNKVFLKRLVETGEKYLNDTTVENELGKILMKIREEAIAKSLAS